MSLIAPQRKLLGHLDRLAALKVGSPLAPVNVEIDLSNRCSLGCEWCHFAYTHTRGPLKDKREKPVGAIAGGDLMDAELAYRLVTELADAGVESVTWTGGGEPTLHPDFDGIVEYAGPFLAQGLYTHGGHVGGYRARLLKRWMTFVYVSLDALDRESYLRDKGVDRFDAACEGIQRLAAADGEATIGLGFLVTRDNWMHAPEALPLARKLGADYVQFRPTIRYEQDAPGVPAEDTSWLEHAAAALARIEDHPMVEVDLSRFRMYQHWGGHSYPTCFWSMLQTVITPSGKAWTCVNKREHPAALIGDLATESFAEMWARQSPARVDGSCRLMCRGHLANLALEEMMSEQKHGAFV